MGHLVHIDPLLAGEGECDVVLFGRLGRVFCAGTGFVGGGVMSRGGHGGSTGRGVGGGR